VEAAAAHGRELSGERARRIVEAMCASVALRGAAGATFDHVAREAGVSRGLLHYHFGSKERLLLEVVRRDAEIRMERLDRALEGAASAEDIIGALLHGLEELVRDDPGFVVLHFELFTLARRNGEVAAETAALGRRTRAQVAELLRRKHREGVLRLADAPEAVAGTLFALGDGLALRMLAEPELDARPLLNAAVAVARALLAGAR